MFSWVSKLWMFLDSRPLAPLEVRLVAYLAALGGSRNSCPVGSGPHTLRQNTNVGEFCLLMALSCASGTARFAVGGNQHSRPVGTEPWQWVWRQRGLMDAPNFPSLLNNSRGRLRVWMWMRRWNYAPESDQLSSDLKWERRRPHNHNRASCLDLAFSVAHSLVDRLS